MSSGKTADGQLTGPGVDFTRNVAKCSIIFYGIEGNQAFWAKITVAWLMLRLWCMVLKVSTNGTAQEQQSKSEPTKCIVQCCELRKKRVGQIALLAETQRIRVKLPN
jgi:hypothetical protein